MKPFWKIVYYLGIAIILLLMAWEVYATNLSAKAINGFIGTFFVMLSAEILRRRAERISRNTK